MDENRRRSLFLVLVIALVILMLDQVTKEIVVRTVDLRDHFGTSQTFFYITHERNEGLVFGIFRDVPWVARTAPLLATLVLAYLYTQLDPGHLWQSIGFGLVLGGAFGNLVDRFFRGFVVDFIQFNFYFIPDSWGLPTKRYPAFNVADMAICVGVAILVFAWYCASKEQSSNVSHAA